MNAGLFCPGLSFPATHVASNLAVQGCTNAAGAWMRKSGPEIAPAPLPGLRQSRGQENHARIPIVFNISENFELAPFFPGK